MNTTRKDGGPAFPLLTLGTVSPFQGMTLRDYFAAAALSGLLASGRTPDAAGQELNLEEAAYRLATRMLAHRAQLPDF